MTKRKKPRGVDGDAFLAAQLSNPRVRHHFEQRRIVHEVAVAVRGMRTGAGLTQAQLATRIGTSQPTIARLEKGLDVRTPRWDTLQRIARALGRQLKLKFAAQSEDGALVEVEQPFRLRKTRAAARAKAVSPTHRSAGSGSPRLTSRRGRNQRIASESRRARQRSGTTP